MNFHIFTVMTVNRCQKMVIKLTSRIRKKWRTCSVVLTHPSHADLWSRLVPSVAALSEFLLLVHKENITCEEVFLFPYKLNEWEHGKRFLSKPGRYVSILLMK